MSGNFFTIASYCSFVISSYGASRYTWFERERNDNPPIISQFLYNQFTTVIHSSSPTEMVTDGLCSVKLSFTIFQYSSCSIAVWSFLKIDFSGPLKSKRVADNIRNPTSFV